MAFLRNEQRTSPFEYNSKALAHPPPPLAPLAAVILRPILLLDSGGCFTGLPNLKWVFPTRRSFVSHLWMISASMADHRMGNSITLEQWKAELQSR